MNKESLKPCDNVNCPICQPLRLERHKYYDLWELFALMGAQAREGCKALTEDHLGLFSTAKGSGHNHQAWEGGYLDHVCETMNIAIVLYYRLNDLRQLPFGLEDALLVMFLHDLEKPFYQRFCSRDEDEGEPKTRIGTYRDVYADVQRQHHPAAIHPKLVRREFRNRLIGAYSIPVTEVQQNALRYVEGENDDYSGMERKMNELAAFCHMCDIASARLWHDKGVAGKW